MTIGALFVKNLSYNVTTEELFDLFGKFGPIRYVLNLFRAASAEASRDRGTTHLITMHGH